MLNLRVTRGMETQFGNRLISRALQELRHGLRSQKGLSYFFQIRCFQSVLTFSILNQPSSFVVYYCFFDVFLSFQVFFNLKVILQMARIPRLISFNARFSVLTNILLVSRRLRDCWLSGSAESFDA